MGAAGTGQTRAVLERINYLDEDGRAYPWDRVPAKGAPSFEIKTRQFSSNWNDPTMWGGTFNVFLLGQKQRSTFSGLIPQYNTVLNLTYQQSILRNWGREVNVAPIRIAQNNSRISESQFRDTVMTTLESTESAYWELVFARRDLEVKRQSLSLAQDLLRINKAKVEVGTLAPIDVTQAEAGVASRLEDLIVAVGSLLTAEDSLRQLLNPGHDDAIWMSTLIPSNQLDFTVVDPDEQEAIDVAKKNRPELAQQRLRVQSNGMQEKIDRRAKRWDLVLEGRYNLEGLEGRGESQPICNFFLLDPSDPTAGTEFLCLDLDGDNTFKPPAAGGDTTPFVFLDTDLQDAVEGLDDTEFADWTVQATLTIPVHNRAAKARYAASRLRHEQSLTQLRNLMLTVEIDVRQKVRDVKVNTQRVRAAQKNRELQVKNVDAEEKKYENGMSTSFQVLEIQEDLATAESQENRAKVDFQKSLAALERAKGTLLEARNIQISGLQDLPGQAYAGGSYGLSGSGR